jgi:hypothetical protein
VSDSRDARARGARFLEATGGELERCAVAVLVGGGPVQPLHEVLARRQRADGAFADPSRPDAASLVETRRAIGLLGDLRALQGPVVERACAWLDGAQAPDGHWAGGAEEALAETGLLAGLLARATCASTGMLDAALDYLATHWSPDRVKGFAWEALAGYSASFANLPHDLGDEILQWCGRELERGYRAGRFDAVRTARVLLWCDAPMLPGGRVSAGELWEALLAQQADDGGWPGTDDAPPETRVARSLDALLALLRFAPAS